MANNSLLEKTRTVRLSAAVDRRIEARAAKNGRTPSELIRDTLEADFLRASKPLGPGSFAVQNRDRLENLIQSFRQHGGSVMANESDPGCRADCNALESRGTNISPWAKNLFLKFSGPYYTTEPVLTEIAHLTGKDQLIIEGLRTGKFLVPEHLADQLDHIERVLNKYPEAGLTGCQPYRIERKLSAADDPFARSQSLRYLSSGRR